VVVEGRVALVEKEVREDRELKYWTIADDCGRLGMIRDD
jgi:hypothetical protein